MYKYEPLVMYYTSPSSHHHQHHHHLHVISRPFDFGTHYTPITPQEQLHTQLQQPYVRKNVGKIGKFRRLGVTFSQVIGGSSLYIGFIRIIITFPEREREAFISKRETSRGFYSEVSAAELLLARVQRRGEWKFGYTLRERVRMMICMQHQQQQPHHLKNDVCSIQIHNGPLKLKVNCRAQKHRHHGFHFPVVYVYLPRERKF